MAPLTEPPGSVSNYYKYVALLDPGLDRSALKKALREDFGVSLSGEVYATPLHREPVFAEFATAAYPTADDVCARQICLPVHSDMTDSEVDRVVEAVGADHDADGLVTARALTRALFISGSLGKGHDVLAEACADALEARGVECQIVDAMAMLGGGPGAAGDWVFRRLLSVNAVYDAFHFSQLRDDGRLARRLDRLAVDWMSPQLRARMDAFQPELVVSVFATGVGAAAPSQGRRLPDHVSRRHDRLVRPPVLGPRVHRPLPGDLFGRGRVGAPLLA